METQQGEILKAALDRSDKRKDDQYEGKDVVQMELNTVKESLRKFFHEEKESGTDSEAMRQALLDAVDDVVKEYQQKPGFEGLDRYDVLSWIDPDMSDKVRQGELVAKWREGQPKAGQDRLPEKKTVVSCRDNVDDIERDLILLVSSPDVPEISANGDPVKEFMRQRLALVQSLKKELGAIPPGALRFYIISSGNDVENAPLIMGIEGEYFNKFYEASRASSLCDNESTKGWERTPGKKFTSELNPTGRLFVHYIRGRESQSGRLEIGNMRGGAAVEPCFTEPRYRGFAKVDEQGKEIVPAGKEISEQANQWINDNVKNLPLYRKLLNVLPGELKKGGVKPWEAGDVIGELQAIIFILATGQTAYSPGRPLSKGEFITNPEDALTMIRDHKFGGGHNRDMMNILYKEVQKLPEFKVVCPGLEYFLDDKSYKPAKAEKEG